MNRLLRRGIGICWSSVCRVQASHEAICLVGYSQPLRGKPIESLPAAQVAAYEEAAPAAATSAQEGGPAAAHIPGTPARRSHSASVPRQNTYHAHLICQGCSCSCPEE